MSQQQTGAINPKTEKILALQEELLTSRKEISNRQAAWEKERNQLLSKQQILTMEAIELRQRLHNLSQINEALMQAVNNSDVTQKTMSGIKSLAQSISGINEQNIFQKTTKGQTKEVQGKTTQKATKLLVLEEENTKLKRTVAEKNEEIRKLNKKVCDLSNSKEADTNKLENIIDELKDKLNNRDEEILSYHKQISELTSREHDLMSQLQMLQRPSNMRDKVPNKKKELTLQQLADPFCNSQGYDQRNSSYLILKPTSDHGSQNTSYYHESEYEPEQFYANDDDEQEKLLCEVCNKVYSVIQFQRHLKDCSNRQMLIEKKRGIEEKLEMIRREEDKQNRKYRSRQEEGRHSEKVLQIQEIMRELGKKQQRVRAKPDSSSYSKFSIKNYNYD